VKRVFDIVLAAAGLVVLSPLMFLTAILIKLDSHGPVLFKQERMGRNFRPFLIYKFRTMRHASDPRARLVTVGGDPRITRLGRLLRQTKMDETPQLVNVLKGDMSFVGPRPEVPMYVKLFQRDYAEILTIRPGITDLASLKYRDEAALLATAADPDEEYRARILPDKIELAKDYLRHSSLVFDLCLIAKTISRIFNYRVPSQ
jgi:lipopolysaccharide/colanic/teichoic acid biosynthesis glycosyltransferase